MGLDWTKHLTIVAMVASRGPVRDSGNRVQLDKAAGWRREGECTGSMD